MKPTGATKEAMDQAVELIDGASNWSDVEYLVTPKVAALFAERERLRELLKATVHAMRSYQHGNSSPDLADEIQLAVNAVLNEVEG